MRVSFAAVVAGHHHQRPRHGKGGSAGGAGVEKRAKFLGRLALEPERHQHGAHDGLRQSTVEQCRPQTRSRLGVERARTVRSASDLAQRRSQPGGLLK